MSEPTPPTATEETGKRSESYGFYAVVAGLLVIGVIYVASLFIYRGVTPNDPADISNNVTASMGAVSGVIGSIVSAYFGVQAGKSSTR
jgi:uncharacterized membrane protein YjfL (UPF0719 family)